MIPSLGKKLTERLNFPNFAWVVVWHVTEVCNSRCIYCTVNKSHIHPHLGLAIDKVIELKPKFVVLAGGEPTLAPGILQHTKRIKEHFGKYITLSLNSNGYY